MMPEYPTQYMVGKLISEGRWDPDPRDPRSLTEREVEIIQLCNQEEIIKQLRRLNANLERTANDVIDDLNGDSQDSLCDRFSNALSTAVDYLDDGKVNGSKGKK